MGSYKYELVVGLHGFPIAASPPHSLYAYDSVSVLTICNGSIQSDSVSCGLGTVQIGSHVFTYRMSSGNWGEDDPAGDTVFEFTPKTSCRSATLTVGAAENYGANPGQSATVEVVQSTTDAQSAVIGDQATGTFHFSLDGGPFYLKEWSTDGAEMEYFAGSFSCYTASGKR